MDLGLHGRVAIITGGAGGIGRACTEALLEENCRVVVADRLPGAAPWPPSVEFRQCDMVEPASVEALAAGVMARYERIDVLINACGIFSSQPLLAITPEEWDRLFQVNLRGVFLACQAVLPFMQRAGWGRIISIASLAGQVGGLVAGAHYAASKAGVLAFTKSLAGQAGSPGITVNAVNPGPVDTPMTADWTAKQVARVTAHIPLGRFATAREVADAIVFLASARAGYIHGTHLDINGGLYMD